MLLFHMTLAQHLLFASVLFSLSALAAEPDFPLASAVECTARQGLPNFLAKVNQVGAEVKIGYFGGSITAQAGWRPKTLAYFQKSYPQAKSVKSMQPSVAQARILAFFA